MPKEDPMSSPNSKVSINRQQLLPQSLRPSCNSRYSTLRRLLQPIILRALQALIFSRPNLSKLPRAELHQKERVSKASSGEEMMRVMMRRPPWRKMTMMCQWKRPPKTRSSISGRSKWKKEYSKPLEDFD
jgi:hypothetical protein